jgi:uncharacterized protein (UPF0333 family)
MDIKGQASAEYLLLALVFLIIVGSVTVPLIGKSIDSSLDVSDTSSVSASINSITNAVGIVYANGPGAKRTINVYFPASGTLSYNTINKTLQMPVTLSNGTNKVIDSNVPITLTINNASSTSITTKGNYNVTVTWPVGSSPISVGLNPS